MKVRFVLLFILMITSAMVHSETPKVIAFAQDTMANDFRKAQVYEVRDALAEGPDIHFIYSDGEGHMALLIRQIEAFISQKVDVLIVGTGDSEAIVPVVSKAYQAGIPVIVLDRGISSKDYTTFINSDNIKIGAMGAAYIAKQLDGKGKVLLFEGLPKADVTQLRNQGFLEEISKYEKISTIKRTGNYLRRDAIIEMEKLLQEGITVDAIFSESDSMLSGVRSVLERNGIEPSSIVMVGCDYTREAQEAIRAGTQSGSILFPLGGRQAAEAARKILKKETVSKHIVIPVQLVTKENIEKVTPIF